MIIIASLLVPDFRGKLGKLCCHTKRKCIKYTLKNIIHSYFLPYFFGCMVIIPKIIICGTKIRSRYN